MNGQWTNMRRISLVVATVVISGLAAVIFWRPPSGSPAELKVRAYVENPYMPEPGVLDGFGLDTIPFLIASATNNQNSAFQKSLLALLWKTPIPQGGIFRSSEIINAEQVQPPWLSTMWPNPSRERFLSWFRTLRIQIRTCGWWLLSHSLKPPQARIPI